MNHSRYQFAAVGEEVVFGLGGVKGVGEAAVEAIIEAREAKPDKKFKSLIDFFESVDLRRVNKKVVECLSKAGAFDNMNNNRAQILGNMEQLLDFADKKRRDRDVGQVSLFEMDESMASEQTIELTNITPWGRSQRLNFEKEVLGFYMSDHPLAGFESILRSHVHCLISGLDKAPVKKKVTLGGIIAGLKEFITKKGTRMAFAQLEDQTGIVEVVIFSDTYLKYQHLLKGSAPLVVSGMHERENDVSKILIDQVTTIESLAQMSREVVVRLKSNEFNPEHIKRLKEVLGRHKGEMRSRLEIEIDDLKSNINLDLGPEYSISPTEAFFEDLENNMGQRGLAGLQ